MSTNIESGCPLPMLQKVSLEIRNQTWGETTKSHSKSLDKFVSLIFLVVAMNFLHGYKDKVGKQKWSGPPGIFFLKLATTNQKPLSLTNLTDVLTTENNLTLRWWRNQPLQLAPKKFMIQISVPFFILNGIAVDEITTIRCRTFTIFLPHRKEWGIVRYNCNSCSHILEICIFFNIKCLTSLPCSVKPVKHQGRHSHSSVGSHLFTS